jgi:hypothetical protein
MILGKKRPFRPFRPSARTTIAIVLFPSGRGLRALNKTEQNKTLDTKMGGLGDMGSAICYFRLGIQALGNSGLPPAGTLTTRSTQGGELATDINQIHTDEIRRHSRGPRLMPVICWKTVNSPNDKDTHVDLYSIMGCVTFSSYHPQQQGKTGYQRRTNGLP